MDHDVFLSYAHEDKEFTDMLREALEAKGVRCWQDIKGIGAGAEWKKEICRALEQSLVMVLVFSSRSQNSKEVAKELSLAGDFNRIVIPVKIEDIPFEDAFKYDLSTVNYLDALQHDKTNIEETADKILKEVDRLRASRPPQEAKEQNLESYREEVREYVSDDGVIDTKERGFLEKFRQQWGIDEQTARAIEQAELAAAPKVSPVPGPDASAPALAEPAPAPMPAVPVPEFAPVPGPELARPVPGPEIPARSRLIYPRFTRSFCTVRIEKKEAEMSEKEWPSLGLEFMSKFEAEIDRRVAGGGWPAGFEPVGEQECSGEEKVSAYYIYSIRKGGSHWFGVEAYESDPEAAGRYFVDVHWAASNAAVRKLLKLVGSDFMVISERIFVPYIAEQESDWTPCFRTAMLVDAPTLVSDEFVQDTASLFLDLIERLTSMGVR